ncbi:MAG: membrane dipeptidase [Anaerolineales bacterium]|jgi:membrane dipeptidase|nr:membrane dipeptidase [Anaerolineales bacterium]
MKPILIDAHQDLAWNMLTCGRDYSLSVQEAREREKDSLIVRKIGDSLLGWPEFQAGRVAVIFATLFAAPLRASEGDWDSQVYRDAEQAHRLYKNQINLYERLFDQHPDKFTALRSIRDLDTVLKNWNEAERPAPTGLLILMEGAEGIRSVDELDEWWEMGVRIIGPAWKSNRYCGGSGEPGPLTDAGRALLAGMAERGFSLDISHLAWESALEALDCYAGPLLSSHANPSKVFGDASSNRFLSDEIIDRLIDRNGVLGIVPFNRFLDRNWQNGEVRLPLESLAAHIDYVCQRAGDARHVGLGTDFDGGFGLQHVPAGLDSIADLGKLIPLLGGRGYTEADIHAIMGGNWQNYLEKSLPT